MREQTNRRVRRIYQQCLAGMQGDCLFLTITIADGLGTYLRPHEWHTLLTRLRQRWPGVQAWTIYEPHHDGAPHLHVVLRNVPGLRQDWVQRILDLVGYGAKADLVPVTDKAGLARYLTKTLAGPRAAVWPPGFRITSRTRRW